MDGKEYVFPGGHDAGQGRDRQRASRVLDVELDDVSGKELPRTPQPAAAAPQPPSHGRGVTLLDYGVVRRPGAEPVGRPTGSANRPTSRSSPRPGSGHVLSPSSSISRKKSLVKPERQRIDPSHPRYHTLTRERSMREAARIDGAPTSPARLRMVGYESDASVAAAGDVVLERDDRRTSYSTPSSHTMHHRHPHGGDAGLSRGASGEKRSAQGETSDAPVGGKSKRRCPSWWVLTSRVLTWYIPNSVLSCFGMRDPAIRQAWREKMALVTIIIFLCGAVGFLTFGFQAVLCGTATDHVRFDQIQENQGVISGRAYNFAGFSHPVTAFTAGLVAGSGNLLDEPTKVGRQDLSFFFQNTMGSCLGLLTPRQGSPARAANGNAAYFFPCQVITQSSSPAAMKAAWGSPSAGQIASCHANAVNAHRLLAVKDSRLKRQDVFYTWDNLTSSTLRGGKLFAYSGLVLDAARLDYLDGNIDKTDPKGIVARVQSGEFSGMDATYHLTRIDPAWGRCLADAIVVGVLDASSVGCVISDIVLYISLLVIVGVVLARFFLAVFFGWFLSWRIGNFEQLTFEERRKREAEIEAWTEQNMALVAANGGVDSPVMGPLSQTGRRGSGSVYGMDRRGSGSVYGMDRSSSPYVDYRRSFLPSTSRFSPAPPSLAKYRAGSTHSAEAAYSATGIGGTPPASPGMNPRFAGDGIRRGSEATGRASLPASNQGSTFTGSGLPPPPALTPFNFQLVHTIMLVTCYSEDTAGLRSSFDSLCTTDYPNTHKMLLVICDGIVMGSGNSASTPDICLSMLEDETVLREHVMPHSYVAIADGSRRHNMAKVYAGFYKYDDRFVPRDKQQRVPMVVVVKCGPQDEARAAKPGNRGKRDSQVLLMSFLQKVMFDERMTTLEYEFFNAIWGVTGVTPDQYEIVLMIDADTKIYPDALTRMIAVMVRDPNVMGLCGETKIANKSDSWVTAIQVFEYYISHHLAKAFESIFGGVTCLPGCFCMYRIKAPKGPHGYWVPILANPDIVEHYSENVVDTLHKKNLLLLGEDRYLSTLMLRTFPKRKMMFVPQAVCKTLVPDTFSVLLSQRRRWINSTVHNLFELVLVRDLCGTFCFSMQFVIFAELVGTLVLPAAITFTFYLVLVSIIPSDQPTPVIPLLLLAAVLGLPAVLILMTTRKIVYVFWMFVYLLSLPIWNFVLPVYAYWHFDDFSWGQTRMVAGEQAGHDHSKKEGEFDSSKIVMKRWCEFEREKRRRTLSTAFVTGSGGYASASPSPPLPLPPGVSSPHLVGAGYTNSLYGHHHRNSSASSFGFPPAGGSPHMH